MARVISIHELTLRSDVSGHEEEFEKLVAERSAPALKAAGFDVRLIKGVRGARIGGYTVLMESDVETFTRFFPLGPGEPTEKAARAIREYADLFDMYDSFVASTRFTDYLETAE